MMFFFMNLDLTFEDYLWEHWPPIPALVRWLLVRALGYWKVGWWRFASCDFNGQPKKLYASGVKDAGTEHE